MKRKLRYILIAGLLLSVGLATYWAYLRQSTKPQAITTLKTADYSQLPGWEHTDPRTSLSAFQISCKAFLKQDPEKSVGSQFIDVKVKDWQPACQAALSTDVASKTNAKAFFETWFTPVLFADNQPLRGLFTGYYMPALHGSLKKTKQYSTPLYGVPDDLITVDLSAFDLTLKHHRKLVGRLQGKHLVPYYTRKEIVNGALKKKSKVLVWIDSEVDRQFLEIEGSGVVVLEDGKKLFIGYAAQNGAPYTPIAKVLIDRGVMTRDNASMQKIRHFFSEHPEKIRSILNQNKSFVFFDKLTHDAALGSQGVPLTPGYSLAIDLNFIPIGAPIWLNTAHPDVDPSKEKAFQRLMIAQDTGGAIRGAVRGDVYWGAGEQATHIAGHMKNPGYYWLLLPKSVAVSLEGKPVKLTPKEIIAHK